MFDNKYPKSEAFLAFVKEMNKKAKAMGLEQTDFEEPDGWAYYSNYTTTNEYAKVIAKGLQYPRLAEVFGCPRKTVYAAGENPRELTMTSTVVVGKNDIAAPLRKDYWLLGGKTGSLSDPLATYNLGINLEHKETGVPITVVAIGEEEDTPAWNRFSRVKALADIAMLLYESGERCITDSDQINDAECRKRVKEIEAVLHPACIAGTVVITPQNGGFDYSSYTEEKNSRLLYSYNGTRKVLQASLAKVMTCLVMLDYVSDWNETFTLKPEDIRNGCDVVTLPGDVFTYRDAMYLLMLPSCNDVACAVARTLGAKML